MKGVERPAREADGCADSKAVDKKQADVEPGCSTRAPATRCHECADYVAAEHHDACDGSLEAWHQCDSSSGVTFMVASSFPRHVAKSSIEAAPLGAEAILYDPDSKRFCQLNATAAIVWEALEHPATALDISGAIRRKCDVPGSAQLETDVAETLRQLLDLSLVRPAPEPSQSA
jgi:hypothetical protein